MSIKRRKDQSLSGKSKRSRICLTSLQKREMCEVKCEYPRLSLADLATQFKCGISTVSDILKEKERWMAIQDDSPDANIKKIRPPKWPKLEEAMTIWIERIFLGNQDIDGAAILNKADKFATAFGITDFKASEGWLTGFKLRHGIKSYCKHGEALSAPSQQEIDTERLKLKEVLKNWEPYNIFNCDETALYWAREPSRVLSKFQVSGRKKSKARITVLLTMNAAGTEKLPPLIINNAKTPRSLRGININNLPVDYYWNKTAWMQVSYLRLFIDDIVHTNTTNLTINS